MKTQHTQGEWMVKQPNNSIYSIQDDSGLTIATCPQDSIEGMGTCEANAKLIAEAGTVTNETGYTPRQLAEQKAELLEALIEMMKQFNVIADSRNEFEQGEALENSEQAIKNATS